MNRFRRMLLTGVAVLALFPELVGAQPSEPFRFETRPARPPATAEKTVVRLELITDPRDPLAIQDWRQALSKLGVSVRVHAGSEDAQPEVKEVLRGSLRDVVLRGRVDRTGRLIFPNRVFQRSQPQALKEWIDELKTYGAQGAPDGKPLWGLNEAQFKSVFAALTEPTRVDLREQKLTAAVQQLKIPAAHPVRFDAAATAWLERHSKLAVVRQDVRTLSSGTALAVLLNDAGLGFRPLRTPGGAIDLVASPVEDLKMPWPIGWDIPEDQSRRETAPKLFELLPVELDDVLLSDVFDVVRTRTGLPLILDLDLIERRAGIEWDAIRVRYPSRQVSWLQVVRGITSPNRLSSDLRLDENGRPFLWISAVGVN